MLDKGKYWLFSLIIIILVLGGSIFYQMQPFISGILGACTIYILVRKQQSYLVYSKKFRPSLAATLICTEVILVFLIPIAITLWILIDRITHVNLNPDALIAYVQDLNKIIHSKINYNLLSSENLMTLTSKLTIVLQVVVNQMSSFVINAVVLIFILYFMLVGGQKMEEYVYELLPFNKTNKRVVLRATKRMVLSNAIGIPLLAVIQGGVATIGYVIFGAPEPILLGFLTCFATIIPLIGTAIVWLPSVVYLLLTGDIFNAVGLGLYALIVITNVDNVIRLILQKRMANTNPIITVFGVVIGLSIFGFWGVIFGPLLLSIFMLCVHLFKRNYLDKKDAQQNVIVKRKSTQK